MRSCAFFATALGAGLMLAACSKPAAPVESATGLDAAASPAAIVAAEPALPADPCAVRYTFGPGTSGLAVLGEGWSDPQPGGVWSDGNRVTVKLPVAKPGVDMNAKFSVTPYLIKAGQRLTFTVQIEDLPAETWVLAGGVEQPALNIPASKTAGQTVTVAFTFSGLKSPKELGASTDPRMLGIWITGLELKSSC